MCANWLQPSDIYFPSRDWSICVVAGLDWPICGTLALGQKLALGISGFPR